MSSEIRSAQSRPSPAGPPLREVREQRCLHLVLARPERRNVLNRSLLDALHAALDRAEADPAVNLLTLSADGDSFCEGMDFAEALSTAAGDPEAEVRHTVRRFQSLLERLTRLPLIVASMVSGRVNAGGMGLVAASDLVYARPGADFGLSEILFGLLPATVTPYLIRRTGFQPTYRMALTGHRLDAARAQGAGLVDELTEDPRDALRRLRLRSDRLSRPAIARMKAYFADFAAAGQAAGQAEEALVALLGDAETGHALRAFLQEQVPPWQTP